MIRTKTFIFSLIILGVISMQSVFAGDHLVNTYEVFKFFHREFFIRFNTKVILMFKVS